VDDDPDHAEHDGREDEDAAEHGGRAAEGGGSALVRVHAHMVARAPRRRQGPLAGVRRRTARFPPGWLAPAPGDDGGMTPDRPADRRRRTVDEHRAAVATLLAPLAGLPAEELAVSAEALAADPHRHTGRVLARDVMSPINLPPFRNSQMDGYAVRAADLSTATDERPAVLRIAPRIPAGTAPAPLAPGTAAPCMTGAPVPPGADAIVPIEAATPDRFVDEAAVDATVSFAAPVDPGAFVRAQGSDLAAGSVLVAAGMRLLPAHLGVLASAGVARVDVRRRPVVLLLSTGLELRGPGEELAPGQIHDANSVALAAALSAAGADVRTLRVASDDADRVRDALRDAAPGIDLLLTTGGVSAGAYEVVRDVLEGSVEFASVAVQPGGPQGLGTADVGGARIPVLAFPGNPVSALVSFELFLRPVLRGIAGHPRPDRLSCELPLAEPLDSPAAKHQVRRGRIDADGRIVAVGGPGSHLLHAYATATHLVHIPVGLDRLEAGDPVTVWSIDD
jgi:molybdopterin molybdotransferase